MINRRFRLRTAFIALGWMALLLVGGAVSLADVVEPVMPAPSTLTKDNPFDVVMAGPEKIRAGEKFTLRYSVHILDKKHYIYKERSSLKVLSEAEGVTLSEPRFSREAERKYDPLEEKDMDIFHDHMTFYVEGVVAATAAAGPRTVTAQIRWQGCNPTVCFFPTKRELPINFEVVNPAASNSATLPPSSVGNTGSPGTLPATSGAGFAAQRRGPDSGAGGFAALFSGDTDAIGAALKLGLFWTFLAVFLFGVLASFTPCIYPIIPITISVLGARQARSKAQGFSLALIYVLGLSVTYTVLGMFAAVTGALFGSWLQSAWVVGSVAVLFIGMGFGMLGVFNVAMPSGISTRLSQVQGNGYPGAFLAGAVAGLVASPCIGPLIVSLLTYIAQTGDIALGAALMFTFAFGMGQLFLILGTFAVSMPKSGAWMDVVKGVLATMLFAVGLYYLKTVVPEGYYELLIGISALAGGTFVGAFVALNEDSSVGLKLQKVGGLILVIVGVYAFVGGLIGTRLVAPQMAALFEAAAHPSMLAQAEKTSAITWSRDYEASMTRARDQAIPVMIDFTAQWCAACQELEHLTYTDERVSHAASAFVTIVVDCTEETDQCLSLKEKYGVLGLPSVLFLDPDGRKIDALTVTGFKPADEFLARMCQVPMGGAQASRLSNVCRGRVLS